MGKHVSEQSRHLKTKDEPQDFPEIDEIDEESRGAKKAKRGFADCGSISFGGIAPVVFAAVLLAALSFLPAEGWMKCVAFLIPFVIAGFAILMDAIDKLIDRKYFEAEQITLVAAIAVFAIGFYTEAVLLLILFRVVRLLETFVSERCGAALKALPEIKPDTANVETAEGVLNVEPDYVNVGDIIQVPAGERIPLDGIIVEGVTTVDTSAISGQARPWDVAVGYKVYSGCTNVTAPIRVRVTKSFEQSTAARLVRMSEKAAQFRSSQESFIRKFISVYTPSILALALVLAVVVPMFNAEWLEMLRRAVIVLICACPSAAVISVSLAYIKSIGAAAKLGIFVKGEDCIESMAMAETMVFDKTGTITEGRYVITDVFPANMTERELLTTAASAEVFSRHPIAYALREAVGIRSAKDMKVTQVEEIPGRGVSAIVGDELVYVGNAALLEEHGILVVETDVSEDFDGLSGNADGSPVIVLNKNFTPERKRFTALHELGHILMKFSDRLTQKQIESLCHLFANEVLIPRNTFKDAVGDISSRPIHINQFVDIQMLYGVSIDALMYKAMKLEMIPQSRYVRYRQRKNKDARFKQIIDESRIGDEKSDRFESLVYKAYAGEIISLSKAASLLQIPESDIRQVYV